MQDSIFLNLQTNIMKILTRDSGKVFTHFEIYDNLLKDLEIKDPIEKENLKIRFLTILRVLPNMFDYVKVTNKSGVLFVSFSIDDDTSSYQTDDSKCDVLESEKEPEKLDEILKSEKEYNMPSEISVINFIIDENMTDYLCRKDYRGNTVLHYLIKNNDHIRIKKYLHKLKNMITISNNDGEEPLEVIKDITVNNLFLNNLYQKMDDMKNKNDEFKKTVSLHFRLINIALLLLFIQPFLISVYLLK